MKPERSFVAARALAQHSPALLRPAPAAAELLPALARAGDRLARGLRGALVPLLGGQVPQVECAAPVEQAVSQCRQPGLAAYSLYAAGADAHPLLSVVDGETALSLLDRAFGGPGNIPAPLPRELTLSAELMVARIEEVVAHQLAAAFGPEAGSIHPLRRAASLADLGGLAEDTRMAVLALTVREGSRGAWTLRIALPVAALADLTGHTAPRAAPAARAAASPLQLPFADMPLTVRAVLVDVPLSLRALGALQVGQILAVPVARNVPLRIAQNVIGHGTIGAVDDRVAIQLTQLS